MRHTFVYLLLYIRPLNLKRNEEERKWKQFNKFYWYFFVWDLVRTFQIVYI